MRLTAASLVLLTVFAAPAAAHASPLYDSFAFDDRETSITYQLPSNPLPLRSTTSGQAILDTAAERAGFSNADLGQYRFRGQNVSGKLSNRSFSAGTNSPEHSFGRLDITAIPEPPPLVLLGTGLLFAAGAVSRFGRARKAGSQTQDSSASKSPLQSRV